MKLNNEQVALLLSLAQNNPDEALQYMQKHNISADDEINTSIPGMKMPLVCALLEDRSYGLTKRLINTSPELTQAVFTIPATPPVIPRPMSGGLLSMLFFKGPVNQDMLSFLLSKGCAATDHFSGFWGATELWQLLALSGDVAGLTLLLEASPNLDVNQKIGDFTFFDIFEHNSSEVVTWLNALKHDMQSITEYLVSLTHDMLWSNFGDHYPDSDTTFNIEITADQISILALELVNKYHSDIEEKIANGSTSQLEVKTRNGMAQALTEVVHQLQACAHQEKIINQERGPELQSCFDLLQSRREEIEAKKYASTGRLSLFWMAAKASSSLVENEESREILETYPRNIVQAVTSAQKYTNL